MSTFLQFTIFGLVLAAIYAVAASGLVVTYTTTGIFNFAHGAIGVVGAFAYSQLANAWGLPAPVAIAIVLVVVGPGMGLLIDKVIMRGLEGVSEVTKVVVTIGLLFGIVALVPIIWPPSRRIPSVAPFFGGEGITLLDVKVSYHQLIAIGIAVVVAIGLRLFLYGSRTGVSMRAVVDNRSLARLTGARPERASAVSWALGCSLAALAGILLAERVSLEVVTLTFLVVNAYAAAVVGRLTSLPLTFLGAVILGLLQSYAQGYISTNPEWVPEGFDITTPLRLAIPVILLFVTLIVMPNAPLRTHGLQRSRESVPKPTWRKALIGFAVLIAAVSILSGFMDQSDTIGWSKGLAIAIIMLSLVPLTGYGGQISLAPMTFAGIGAFTAANVSHGNGSWVGVLAAVVVSALTGALIALPALRLRGIYLALATLAFAYFVDQVVFTQQKWVGSGSKPLERLSLGPIDLSSSRSYMIFLAVLFCIVGAGVVLLRRGPFGRRLQAMKDSPAACATLGLNLTVTKMQVFMLSAAIAGLGGVLLSGVQETVAATDYNAITNLPVVLLAVAGGIAVVSGAIFGGILFAAFSIIAKALPDFDLFGVEGKDLIEDLFLVAPGLIGISLGRNPNGAVNEISTKFRERWEQSRLPKAERVRNPSPGSLSQTLSLETLGIDRPFTASDLQIVDAALGLDDDTYAVYRDGAARSWSGAGQPAGVGAGPSANGAGAVGEEVPGGSARR
jgi:branched-subunit amino acid ABC-type transport system permease component